MKVSTKVMFAIAAILGLSAGVGLFLVQQSDAGTVNENASVCFDSDGIAGRIAGFVTVQGCYSSSCTRVPERSFEVNVDEPNKEIRVSARFVLESTDAMICTMDCGGAGQVWFDMDGYEPRVYDVYVSGTLKGELDLSDSSQQACF